MSKLHRLHSMLKESILQHKLLSTVFIVATLISISFLGTKYFSNINPLKLQRDEIIYQKIEQPHFAINIFSDETTVTPPFKMPKIEQPQFSDRTCPITSYGAIGDGKTLNTQAFSAAIADCAKNGGGIVEVPAGQWLTGNIRLADKINLHLNDKAVVIFSNLPENYLPAVFSRYEGIEHMGYAPFIYADNCTDIAITGKGILEGQGHLWWKRNNMKATYSLYDMAAENVPVKNRIFADINNMLRPSFIEFINCNSVLLEDFTVRNSPMWTIHPIYSSNIIMKNITVDTLGLNTDGIAIDSSRNVLVENSTVKSGDDAIVIKSGRDRDGLRVDKPSKNIVIRNCQILEGHGGIAIGSEVSGGISNVFAYDLYIDEANFGFRIKSSTGRGGIIENIWAQNITMRKIKRTAIQITTNYDEPYRSDYTDTSTIRNVFIDTMRAEKTNSVLSLIGLPEKPIENVSIKNITAFSKNETDLRNTKNITMENMDIKIAN